MAKLGNFLQVSDIRGSVGGNVYTQGRSGSTLRVRVKPKNPRSAQQTIIRDTLTTSTRTAVGLTALQIGDWKTYALSITKHQSVSGAAYHPSWLTIYNEYSIFYKIVNAGGVPPTSPPTSPFVGDTITISVTSPAANEIEFSPSAPNSAGIKTILYIGEVPGFARTPTEQMTRIGNITAFPLSAPVIFSALTTGKTYAVGYRFVNTATGQASNFVFIGGVVAT